MENGKEKEETFNSEEEERDINTWAPMCGRCLLLFPRIRHTVRTYDRCQPCLWSAEQKKQYTRHAYKHRTLPLPDIYPEAIFQPAAADRGEARTTRERAK